MMSPAGSYNWMFGLSATVPVPCLLPAPCHSSHSLWPFKTIAPNCLVSFWSCLYCSVLLQTQKSKAHWHVFTFIICMYVSICTNMWPQSELTCVWTHAYSSTCDLAWSCTHVNVYTLTTCAHAYNFHTHTCWHWKALRICMCVHMWICASISLSSELHRWKQVYLYGYVTLLRTTHLWMHTYVLTWYQYVTILRAYMHWTWAYVPTCDHGWN